MRTAVTAIAMVAWAALSVQAVPSAKNFIYIVPDGFGPASQTMARDYVSLIQNGENPDRPVGFQLPGDKMVLGNVRTHASDALVTDSAASGTAFACGIKTYNAAIGVNDAVEPVGSILEAAHLSGMKTGLVVTSTINHATPASYSAHVAHRDMYADIAKHQIGYNHPFGPFVDILMGGGRCYYKPQGESGSCRPDDADLFGFAQENGYHVMQNRTAFDALDKGLGDTNLPFIGLFNDGQMMYEIDRSRNPTQEPSLLEMAETAINALDRATSSGDKGYFLMIEASRIDHAGHANDPASHLFDIIMYNEVLEYVQKWIDEHPDTMLMSAADHECGALTLPGYNPLPMKAATASTEALVRRYDEFSGDKRAFLRSEILPAYGLADATDAEVNTLLSSGNLGSEMGNLLASRAGIHWASGGHSAVDVVLYGYASSDKLAEYKASMAGNHDNTALPKFVEQVLGIDMSAATELIRANATEGWMGTPPTNFRTSTHAHGDHDPTHQQMLPLFR
ncbi:hypothetical protein MCOR27_003369 [Pyricularia oryzae]|uniref:Alkaline phosphatase n=2 Tax=Pyricularia TaxID=48558 RepID=A0ABQ8NJF4_PYRGI|nr:hypothetical protein MCOR01_001728 [Pyricularia oryzae]KAI6298049.1 hypothetical protein MCOR33_005761 [Pyricularia grisea]KAI6283203.1 hypothetical protein MCOR27_003369 [Pyricularia oryzae]KAI6327172.1 hypothetical protein MCOR29_003127 [Pyricularia oryzae]KAI6331337.1 hypothetical protein MCOR30_004836 [Pyricularia oryzae]